MKNNKKVNLNVEPRTKKPVNGIGSRVPVENTKGITINNKI